MNSNQNSTLIDGEFAPADAKQILKNMFWSKMQFHEMRNFSSVERLGTEDKHAQKRIIELKQSLEKLLEIVALADANNETLAISAEISIQRLHPKEKTENLIVSEALS